MHSNISGLEPSTKYDFRLKGFNSAGVGENATLEAFTAVETGIVGHHSNIKISKYTNGDLPFFICYFVA